MSLALRQWIQVRHPSFLGAGAAGDVEDVAVGCRSRHPPAERSRMGDEEEAEGAGGGGAGGQARGRHRGEVPQGRGKGHHRRIGGGRRWRCLLASFRVQICPQPGSSWGDAAPNRLNPISASLLDRSAPRFSTCPPPIFPCAPPNPIAQSRAARPVDTCAPSSFLQAVPPPSRAASASPKA